MKQYTVEFYHKENGETPALDFITILNKKMMAKVFQVIGILEEFGPQTRMPYSRYLREGIFEIRAQQGTDITRVLYFFFDGKRIILTNGFVKKTQRTPDKEIQIALEYKEDYEWRNK